MDKTRELLLRYQGKNGFDGVCHVRVYEQPGQLPTVIAGALEDNPGTSITNAIEMVAAAVQRSQFPEGREFKLIEHYPDTIDRRGTPTYALIHFEHRATHERPNDPSNHAGQIVVIGDDPAEEPAVARGKRPRLNRPTLAERDIKRHATKPPKTPAQTPRATHTTTPRDPPRRHPRKPRTQPPRSGPAPKHPQPMTSRSRLYAPKGCKC